MKGTLFDAPLVIKNRLKITFCTLMDFMVASINLYFCYIQ